MDHEASGRRAWLGCLALMGAILVCGVGGTFTLDLLCNTTLRQRLPIYPGAELRAERHNLFRMLGMGESYLELYSPDAPDTVRQWYAQTAGRFIRQAIQSGDPLYRLATAERSIRRAEDGTGSFIQLYGTCAQ